MNASIINLNSIDEVGEIIANNIYITNTIKYPEPQLTVLVWQVLHEDDILFTSFNYSYIQAPSMIINKMNNTNTIAAEDPQQFPIYTILLFLSFHK